MGMYSTFVLAEPADLPIDLKTVPGVGRELPVDDIHTLTELGNAMNGWKLYGYFGSFFGRDGGQLYRDIVTEIHRQHPTVDFKLHFWYEENIMFHFSWSKGAAKVFYGDMNDCDYFVKRGILNDAAAIQELFTSRYDEKSFKSQATIDRFYELAEK